MAPDDGIPVPVHDVLRGLALVAEGVDVALCARTWSLSRSEVRAAITELDRQRHRLDAVLLHLVRASAAGDDGAEPGRETRQWLQATLRLTATQARSTVENARTADPDGAALREFGDALAAGEITLEHVDAARRTVDKLPAGVIREHREQISGTLVDSSRRLNGHDTRQVCQHLLGVLAPASSDRLDPMLRERRYCEYALSSAGVLRGTFLLEGHDAATANAVLDHLAAPGGDQQIEHATHQQPLAEISDSRTLAQRRADALATALRLAQTSPQAGTRGAEPPHLLIHTTTDQLAWQPALAARGARGRATPGLASPPHAGGTPCEQTGPISAALLQRAACDAVIQRVVLDHHGALVELRSPHRLANRAQRRALAARDRGCAWPGCSIPAAGCDAHHIVYWSRGGETTLENLVLLCPRHHTEIHCEEWAITMRHGVPWFLPPRHLDPGQQPLRNNLHDHVAEVTRLAQHIQLRLTPEAPDTG